MNRQEKESETPAVTAEKGPCQHKHKFSTTQLKKQGEEGIQGFTRAVKETWGKNSCPETENQNHLKKLLCTCTNINY